MQFDDDETRDRLREYLQEELNGFIRDPSDSHFQAGYLAALGAMVEAFFETDLALNALLTMAVDLNAGASATIPF